MILAFPSQDDKMRLTKVLDMYTDYYYFSPLDATLKLHNQNAPEKAYMYGSFSLFNSSFSFSFNIFYCLVLKTTSSHYYTRYMFDHRSDISSLPEWLGIPKGEAMLYMFGFPFFDKTDPRTVFWDHLRHFNMDRAWTPLDRHVTNPWKKDSCCGRQLTLRFDCGL